MNNKVIDGFFDALDNTHKERVADVIDKIVKIKQEKEKIVVATGSGPNIHEGVTTLIAELIDKGIIDGVLTSSAVVAHEMGGALDKVKRVAAGGMKIRGDADVWLPRGEEFELSVLSPEQLDEISAEMELDMDLIRTLQEMEGKTIIKAAGNMAYPMGLRTETLAASILRICKDKFNGKYPFELIAGLGADPLTMIGAGVLKGVPVMVSIPQLVGGGAVGLSIGDSTSIHDRSAKNAEMLGSASMIIESGLALAQEIHDGPFETYTGHGIWAQWQGFPVYSLDGKILVRMDLDPNLERAWQQQRDSSMVQEAIAKGLPKTKITGVPFRMEMSGFARLETSIPLIGDLGELWPIIASRASADLGIKLDFMSYKQETDEGREMREFIVDNVKYMNIDRLNKGVAKLE
ncbi:MAG: hypothetical protein ACTSUE_21440 [Promethearchaeota archaeon]